MSEEITVHGPIFAGMAPDVLAAYYSEASDRVGDVAQSEVRTILSTRVRHRTGFYESHIVTDRSVSDAVKVTDSNVIYGPWLEGTSRRNRTSRFKGYHAFRVATYNLNNSPKVTKALEEVMTRYVGRLS